MTNLENLFPDGVQPVAGDERKETLGENPIGKPQGNPQGAPVGKLPENLTEILGATRKS